MASFGHDGLMEPNCNCTCNCNCNFDATLLSRWKNRARYVVFDDRFEGGGRFWHMLAAWRNDPHRCAQLHVITASPTIAAGCTAAALLATIAHDWPPITPNMHRLAFDGGQVQWLLVPADTQAALRQLVAQVDIFLLSPANAPDEATARRHAKALARLAAVGTVVHIGGGLDAAGTATATAAGALTQHAMRSSGFRPTATDVAHAVAHAFAPAFAHAVAPAFASAAALEVAPAVATTVAPVVAPVVAPAVSTDEPASAASTVRSWRYDPPFAPRHAPSRSGAHALSPNPVLIIGAGLAGCAVAWALAEQAIASTVFERHDAPAMETSGNPAGLFHGIVNPQDGAHARFNRAAALEAQRAVATALAQHGVRGSTAGLLRLQTALTHDAAVADMHALLQRLHLPADYVQALSASDASQRAGLPLRQPAWWYPGGGWVQPAGLARSFIERAGRHTALRTGCAVDRLTRSTAGWELRNAAGAVIAHSDRVVLANAGDALRLLQPWLPPTQAAVWPLAQVRGQISIAAVSTQAADLSATQVAAQAAAQVAAHVAIERAVPQVPITGSGYVLPMIDGLVIFGATAQAGDGDPSVRDVDHVHNLAQWSRLTGAAQPLALEPSQLSGRTGWRWATADRLPLLGGVPDFDTALGLRRLEQPACVPRLPGLYVCTALGSRGITWAALAAQVVAAQISGSPLPIEADLLDALDAGRFAARVARRSG